MTIAEFEEAFQEEYRIPEMALPDAKAKLWAMKPKKEGLQAYMWDIVKEVRALFGLKTGQNFSKEQGTELIYIITKELPAGIHQFIHKEGQSTLDQLMKSVRLAQSFGLDTSGQVNELSIQSLEMLDPLNEKLEKQEAELA